MSGSELVFQLLCSHVTVVFSALPEGPESSMARARGHPRGAGMPGSPQRGHGEYPWAHPFCITPAISSGQNNDSGLGNDSQGRPRLSPGPGNTLPDVVIEILQVG